MNQKDMIKAIDDFKLFLEYETTYINEIKDYIETYHEALDDPSSNDIDDDLRYILIDFRDIVKQSNQDIQNLIIDESLPGLINGLIKIKDHREKALLSHTVHFNCINADNTLNSAGKKALKND
jgi:hypothetical protein